MTLTQKQFLFTECIAALIRWAYVNGYQITCGDFQAFPQDARHKHNSLHYSRLAADLNLFRDGKYLTATEDHKPLGDYWESLHPMCRWGGRWSDGNHYEINPQEKP